MHLYANQILKQDGIKYSEIKESTSNSAAYLEAVKEASLEKLGYFLKPSELFHAMAERGADGSFVLDDLSAVLTSIEQSTMGTDSEEEFSNLFEDLLTLPQANLVNLKKKERAYH